VKGWKSGLFVSFVHAPGSGSAFPIQIPDLGEPAQTNADPDPTLILTNKPHEEKFERGGKGEFWKDMGGQSP